MGNKIPIKDLASSRADHPPEFSLWEGGLTIPKQEDLGRTQEWITARKTTNSRDYLKKVQYLWNFVEPNWEGENESPIYWAIIEQLEEIVSFFPTGLPYPLVTPRPDGTASLKLRRGENLFHFHIDHNIRISFFYKYKPNSRLKEQKGAISGPVSGIIFSKQFRKILYKLKSKSDLPVDYPEIYDNNSSYIPERL